MTTSPQHLFHFEGGNALSAFRAQALLPRLQAVNPRITAVHARHVHWVWSDHALAGAEHDKLEALLRYGDPYEGPADGTLLVVAPRLGTVSPWASKATDIAHNCGLAIRRVERVTEYQLVLKSGLLGGAKALSDDELRQCAALLHDRMTESVLLARGDAKHLFDGNRRPVCCEHAQSTRAAIELVAESRKIHGALPTRGGQHLDASITTQHWQFEPEHLRLRWEVQEQLARREPELGRDPILHGDRAGAVVGDPLE